ncbi:ion channel [Zunongwangia endophytica]|uniref:Ion channel n=1 Tax=Zunongwangia endophytica TaxID=1808945 RepID=A0ABV8H670_9FLAO|nr:transporter substrate-binding domain-containing protein [Zunongwangia endophytica]MDN3595996.1 transporter substrate-binding domain-containing protein [Zunongwangia endophytica]
MARTLSLLIFFSLCISPHISFGQEDTIASTSRSNLVVGVTSKPPYAYKDQEGNWEGISIRLWRKLAEDLDENYTYKEIDQVDSITINQVDLFVLGDIAENSKEKLDFSHIYHISEIGTATKSGMKMKSVLKAFFSKKFWYIAGSLSILLLIVGSIIYFVERRHNEDNFGGERSIAKGIGSGFWWAGVTMTTIGYGDKAPVTFTGRAIALVWMLVAMAVTSVLTASLVSAVMGSGNNQIQVPNDLRDMKVAVVNGSSAESYLNAERIAFKGYNDIPSALEDLKTDDIEVLLHSVPQLRYAINNRSKFSAKVRSANIDPHYYAFAFPVDSDLRLPVNNALIEVLRSPEWQKELDRFIPEKKSQ